jgi:hypothetical protein
MAASLPTSKRLSLALASILPLARETDKNSTSVRSIDLTDEGDTVMVSWHDEEEDDDVEEAMDSLRVLDECDGGRTDEEGELMLFEFSQEPTFQGSRSTTESKANKFSEVPVQDPTAKSSLETTRTQPRRSAFLEMEKLHQQDTGEDSPKGNVFHNSQHQHGQLLPLESVGTHGFHQQAPPHTLSHNININICHNVADFLLRESSTGQTSRHTAAADSHDDYTTDIFAPQDEAAEPIVAEEDPDDDPPEIVSPLPHRRVIEVRFGIERYGRRRPLRRRKGKSKLRKVMIAKP